MHACVLHNVGDLRFEDVPRPDAGPGEVVLRVAACGVCGSDIPRVFVKGTYNFPMIPGHELAGVVEAVGPEVDRALIGRQAAVFPLIPCMKCTLCEVGEYAQCTDYNYLGSRCDGGFAEYVRVPAWNLALTPPGVSLEEAAMTEPAAVAVHALRQGGIDIGDHVLIVGAGPIGLMVAMWAQAWGAGEVMLADIDERKLAFARELGFQNTFNPRDEGIGEWVKRLTGSGADLAVEAAGNAAALEQCLLLVRPLGRVVLMGNPDGDVTLPQQAYWGILRKQLKLVGTWNSSYSSLPRNEWKLTLDFIASGKLNVQRLITHRVALNELADAMRKMRDRSEFSTKILFVNQD